MLDMGFIHDIKKVLAIIPAKKQSLLFSATFSDEIKTLADRLLNKPQVIEVARRNTTAENIAQRVLMVGRERKKDLLAHLVKNEDWHQVLVFTRMKHGANRLVEFLDKAGISAMAIHGNKSQGARTKALADFKNGELRVLVATDIAARGIDIDQLPHVVNFELPNVPEDYVHRIGRTGRAGATGEALSLVCLDEEDFLGNIEKLIKRSIPREVVEGFEIPASERPEPIQIGRRTLNGGGGNGGRSAPRGDMSRDGAARRGNGGGGGAGSGDRNSRPGGSPARGSGSGANTGGSSHAGNRGGSSAPRGAGGHAPASNGRGQADAPRDGRSADTRERRPSTSGPSQPRPAFNAPRRGN
jgi:ATP-dependent RNA helicase RhlE